MTPTPKFFDVWTPSGHYLGTIIAGCKFDPLPLAGGCYMTYAMGCNTIAKKHLLKGLTK